MRERPGLEVLVPGVAPGSGTAVVAPQALVPRARVVAGEMEAGRPGPEGVVLPVALASGIRWCGTEPPESSGGGGGGAEDAG